MKSWTKTSRGAIASLTGVNAIGAGAGLLQAIVIAYHFGTSVEFEVYVAATTLLVSTTALMQSGQLSDIFLPQYHRIRQSSIPAARESFAVLLNWMLLAAGILAVLIALAAPIVMGWIVPGFDDGELARAITVFRAVAPLIPLDVALALTMMFANAERWYGRPEMAATLASIVSVATIAVLGSPWGEWTLAAALWAGKLVHIAGVLLVLRRLGYRHAWRLQSAELRMRSVLSPMASAFVYVGATQVWTGAFTAGLSLLPQGTLAVFRYVSLFATRARTIFMRPVSVVFFTDISRILAGEPGDVRAVSRLALGRCFAIWTLVMAAVIAGGRPGLQALLGWKTFSTDQLELAYVLLIAFTAMTGFTAFDWVWRKTVVTIGRVRELYIASSVAQVICAAIAVPLMRATGIAGLITVSALNGLFLAMASWSLLSNTDRALRAGLPFSSFWRWTMAAAAGAAVATLLTPFVIDIAATARPGLALAAVALGGGAALVGIGVALALRVPEIRELPHISPTPVVDLTTPHGDPLT